MPYKAHPKFSGLSSSQIRDIHKSDRPLAELAKFYGVPAKVIRGVKISVGRTKARKARQAAA